MLQRLFDRVAFVLLAGCLLFGALASAASAWRWDSSFQGDVPDAADIFVDTATFNNNLSSADDTVQKALETLDDVAGGGGSGDITAVTAGNGLTGGATSGAANLDVGAGAGIAVAADSVAWDPSTFVNNISMWNAANATRTWTANLSGATDPVWTYGDGVANLSTGTLQQGGTAVVLQNRTISTTSPLSGGGDLSANRTLSIADAAADGTTKGAASFTAADFDASSGNVSLDYANAQKASGSQHGFLSSTDWTTFNGKQAALFDATSGSYKFDNDLSQSQTGSVWRALVDLDSNQAIVENWDTAEGKYIWGLFHRNWTAGALGSLLNGGRPFIGLDSSYNIYITGALQFREMAAPSTPEAGSFWVYPKTDGFLYGKNDAGLEQAITGQPVTFGITIDGGGSAITTGVKGYVRIPFAMTIDSWDIVADQSGSCVVDIWRDTYANFPPTVADTIAGTEKPTLSSSQKNQDTSLSSWNLVVAADDYIGFNVDSATTVQRVHVSIKGKRR